MFHQQPNPTSKTNKKHRVPKVCSSFVLLSCIIRLILAFSSGPFTADEFLQMNPVRFPDVSCVLCGGEVQKSKLPGSGGLGPCPEWKAKYRAGKLASLQFTYVPLQYPQFGVHLSDSTLTEFPIKS